jgi:hypothetical protein
LLARKSTSSPELGIVACEEITASPENKSDVIKVNETVLAKCRQDLPMKVGPLRDIFT